MKTIIKTAALAAMTLGAATALPTIAHAQAAGSVIIVDMDRVGAASSAGRSAQSQLKAKLDSFQARQKTLQAQFQGEADALRKVQESKSMAPEAFQAKVKDLQTRQATANNELAGREQDFVRSQAYVRQQIFTAVNPIIQQVMREKGARVVVAREAALSYDPALDVTNDVIARLDKALPSVNVNPPAQPAAKK